MAARVPKVATALARALRERPLGVEDAATVALAKRLAFEIDGTDALTTLERLTPKYLAVLSALGLTPASRNATRGPSEGSGPVHGAGAGGSGGGVIGSVGRDVVAEQRARYADPR